MAKRPRKPLWRRPYTSFRLGSDKPPDPNLEEQRITLYLPAGLLDWAEAQAVRLKFPTIQAYCTKLLQQELEAERATTQIADAEAKHGAFEGLAAIAEDVEYLAEWNSSQHAPGNAPASRRVEVTLTPTDDETTSRGLPMPVPRGEASLSASALTVIRHATTDGEDSNGFLSTLRRGESIALDLVQPLFQALNQLEAEYRNSSVIDRRVAYALHRLAFEGQILHTDAWPGQLDATTVDVLRSLQEAVDRVLSGEDIRYYAQES